MHQITGTNGRRLTMDNDLLKKTLQTTLGVSQKKELIRGYLSCYRGSIKRWYQMLNLKPISYYCNFDFN